MGVCIDICFIAVSRPPGVPDCDVVVVLGSSVDRHSLDTITAEAVRAGEFGSDPHGLVLFVTGDGDNTTRVVATRLKDLQTLDADWSGLRPVAEVSNDAAAFVSF